MMLPLGHAYFTLPDCAVLVHALGALDVYQASTTLTGSAVSRTIGTPAATAEAGIAFMLWPRGYIGNCPLSCAAEAAVQTSTLAARSVLSWINVFMVFFLLD